MECVSKDFFSFFGFYQKGPRGLLLLENLFNNLINWGNGCRVSYVTFGRLLLRGRIENIFLFSVCAKLPKQKYLFHEKINFSSYL